MLFMDVMMDLDSSNHRFNAATALIASAVGWALAPIFIRYLSHYYDPHTQNLLRYACAVPPLVALSLVYHPTDLKAAFRDWRGMGGIALLNVAQQHAWTLGCAGSTATTAQLLSKLSIVFVIILSLILFQEERRGIASPIYLFGTLLSFAGVGLVTVRNPDSFLPVLDVPTLLLLLTALLWGVYTVWGKRLVLTIHPVPMFAVVSIYTTVGFSLLAAFTGHPGHIMDAGLSPFLLGLISGWIPIALAHPAFHYAQRHLGSAFCSSVALFNPLVTYAIALWVFPDEGLLATQWAGAAALMTGTFMVVYSRRNQGAA